MRFLIFTLIAGALSLFAPSDANAAGALPINPSFQGITITSCNGGILLFNGAGAQGTCVIPGLNVMASYQNGTNDVNGFVTSSNATAIDKVLAGGASTPSWLAVNNCSTALTYSTGTHTFSCNGSVSNGTVAPSVNGLSISNNGATPNTKMDISATNAVIANSTLTGGQICTSFSQTMNAGVTGANGLDTGALAASTWYYLYIIGNGTTCSSLASLSSTAPTMPGGYTFLQRVGAVTTDGSSVFYRFLQKGKRSKYVVTSATNTAALIQLSNATTGSPTTPTWTSFQVTGNTKVFPTTAVSGIFSVGENGAGGACAVMLAPNSAYGAYNSTTNPPPIVTNNIVSLHLAELVLESNSVSFASNCGTSTTFNAVGWTDAVPAN